MTHKIHETTIGAVCGNDQAKKLIGDSRGLWLHPLSSDRLSPEALVVLDQPTGSLDSITMTSNPANQSLVGQFLRWRQDMEAKQEEQARQMVGQQSHADHLQQENDRLRTRLEGERAKNVRGSGHPAPQSNKIKAKSLSGRKIAMLQRMTSYLPTAPRFRIHYPKRIMWRPSRERGPRNVLAGPLAACLVRYGENLAGKGDRWNAPLKTYPHGSKALHHHFPLGIQPSERHSSCLCPYLSSSGDLRTCCHPH